MLQLMEELKAQESVKMTNELVERCFNDCIMNFSTKSLDKKEISCLENCAEKFVKHSVRSAQKFQEASQEIQVPQAPGV